MSAMKADYLFNRRPQTPVPFVFELVVNEKIGLFSTDPVSDRLLLNKKTSVMRVAFLIQGDYISSY